MSGFGLVRRVALGFGYRVGSGCGRRELAGLVVHLIVRGGSRSSGAADPGDYEADGDGRGPDRPCGERVVPQEDARNQGQDEADRAEYLGQPPTCPSTAAATRPLRLSRPSSDKSAVWAFSELAYLLANIAGGPWARAR